MGCTPAAEAGGDVESSEVRPGGEAEARGPLAAEPAPGPEPATEPIECAGDESITAEDITIRSDRGPVIRAAGQCRVTLTGAELSSGGVAVIASGSARVTLRDSQVRGASAAVVASDSAIVELPGTEVHGEVLLAGEGGTDG